MRGGPDVSREGVQRDILPIVEGSTVSTKHGPIKTDHMLFIAAGAFHISKPSDLIPELQGRLPIRVELDSLTAEDFKTILTQPKNALVEQYKALLATDGVTLEFQRRRDRADRDVRDAVNEQTENIGARRLADRPRAGAGRRQLRRARVGRRRRDRRRLRPRAPRRRRGERRPFGVHSLRKSQKVLNAIHIRSGRVWTRAQRMFYRMKKPIGALSALFAAAGALAGCNGNVNNPTPTPPSGPGGTAAVRRPKPARSALSDSGHEKGLAYPGEHLRRDQGTVTAEQQLQFLPARNRTEPRRLRVSFR